MAAPATKSMADLSGKWVMNKTISDNVEPALALQGIGYLTRKAIGLSTVTLHIKQYTGPAEEPATPGSFVHIDIDQTATGGIKGTSEYRTLDNKIREHGDWLFGNVKARSTWVSAEGLAAAAKEFNDYIVTGWSEEGEVAGGPNGETHLLNYVEADAGWTAVQVWGFQIIGGERRYARNISVSKGDKTVNIRFVYDYSP